MDPIQFRIDWELLAELLVTLIVLAFFVERALALIFENKAFINSSLDDNGTKEVVAFVASIAVVRYVGLDALSVLFKMDAPSWLGYVVTAGIVAGGSKASIKLFHDLMDLKSSARRQKDAIKKIQRDAQLQQVAVDAGLRAAVAPPQVDQVNAAVRPPQEMPKYKVS